MWSDEDRATVDLAATVAGALQLLSPEKRASVLTWFNCRLSYGCGRRNTRG